MKRFASLLATASAALLLLVPAVFAQETTKPLTVEGIFAHESVMGTPPRGLAWSPDGKHLTYIDGGELVDLDPGSHKPHVLVSQRSFPRWQGHKVQSRTAIIASATEWRTICGRRTQST